MSKDCKDIKKRLASARDRVAGVEKERHPSCNDEKVTLDGLIDFARMCDRQAIENKHCVDLFQ